MNPERWYVLDCEYDDRYVNNQYITQKVGQMQTQTDHIKISLPNLDIKMRSI